MTLKRTLSYSPFMNTTAADHRFLLVDGALFPEGLRWFWEQEATESPILVLADGQYDALSSMGPILVPLMNDCHLTSLWEDQNARLKSGAILYVSDTAQTLTRWLRARSKVFLPDHRLVWLRLGDAAILGRLLENHLQAPAHFWSGIDGITLSSSEGFIHTDMNSTDEPDKPLVLTDQIEPHFHFSSMLVSALQRAKTHGHREVS